MRCCSDTPGVQRRQSDILHITDHSGRLTRWPCHQKLGLPAGPAAAEERINFLRWRRTNIRPRKAALGVEEAGFVRGDDELDPVSGAEFGQQPGTSRPLLAGAGLRAF